MPQKLMIFIDGSNLFWACREYQEGYRIDIEKLRKLLVEQKPDRQLVRAYYYGSEDPQYKNYARQQRFHSALRYAGFTVVTKKIRYYPQPDGSVKIKEKGVDVALVTDLLYCGLKHFYDVAIIVSGDSDLVGAIKKVKEADPSIHIELAQFRNCIGGELLQIADNYYQLDDFAQKINRKKKYF